VPERQPNAWPRIQGNGSESLEFRDDAENTPSQIKSLTTLPKQSKLPALDEGQRRRTETAVENTEAAPEGGSTFGWSFVLILLFAAALGCGAGYWAYQQLPAPVIPVSVRPGTAGLLVTWPIEQTRQAAYAAIRVNDGVQQPLSVEEKSAGVARITTGPLSNVKVELIVQHWMRDSRGIVRYVTAMPAPISQDQQIVR
jgi:hypothetical protein